MVDTVGGGGKELELVCDEQRKKNAMRDGVLVVTSEPPLFEQFLTDLSAFEMKETLAESLILIKPIGEESNEFQGRYSEDQFRDHQSSIVNLPIKHSFENTKRETSKNSQIRLRSTPFFHEEKRARALYSYPGVAKPRADFCLWGRKPADV